MPAKPRIQFENAQYHVWTRGNDRQDLFRNRFRSSLILSEEYFLEVCRYVVLNPVRAGLCSRPEEWRWSSYSATAGLAPAPMFLSVGPLLKCFSNEPSRAERAYREFVANAENAPRTDEDLEARRLLDVAAAPIPSVAA